MKKWESEEGYKIIETLQCLHSVVDVYGGFEIKNLSTHTVRDKCPEHILKIASILDKENISLDKARNISIYIGEGHIHYRMKNPKDELWFHIYIELPNNLLNNISGMGFENESYPIYLLVYKRE